MLSKLNKQNTAQLSRYNKSDKMLTNIDLIINKPEFNDFCKKHEIIELSVFGSILRDDFNADSDIDFLVTFGEKSKHTLFDSVRMQEELQTILGLPVDFVSKKAIEKSSNYFRKKAILEHTKVIYAA